MYVCVVCVYVCVCCGVCVVCVYVCVCIVCVCIVVCVCVCVCVCVVYEHVCGCEKHQKDHQQTRAQDQSFWAGWVGQGPACVSPEDAPSDSCQPA